MPGVPPPNPDLADLAALLGVDNVRLLVRTFLNEYPQLLQQLSTGDRKTRQRMAHSLKSNSRVIGARELSARMAALEERLGRANEPDLKPAEIESISADFATFAHSLRAFAGAA
jgi:HPt (histidine-containing phosphotransfer) domain-containing protein